MRKRKRKSAIHTALEEKGKLLMPHYKDSVQINCRGMGWFLLLMGFVFLSFAHAESALADIVNPSSNMKTLPHFVLWAWERSENLSYINTETTAIAFHAVHIRINGKKIFIKRRRHSLIVPQGAQLIAVAHLSVNQPSVEVIKSVRDIVIGLAGQRGVTGVQLDYEAVLSQRDFYKELAAEIRGGLRTNYSFTATALASWCLADRWMDPGPFSDVVPMYFDMGRSGSDILNRLDSGSLREASYCMSSAGIKVGDKIPDILKNRRRWYVFNPKRWDEQTYQNLITTMH